MKKFHIGFILVFFCLPGFSQDWKNYPYNPPANSKISFPLDEGRHTAEPEEWWYTAGHLVGETTGNHYSFMLTYFYHPAVVPPGVSFDGFRILNISNDDKGLFTQETLPANYAVLANDKLDILASLFPNGLESFKNKKDDSQNPIPFEYEISAESASGSLDLELVSLKRPLILADSGFLYQGDDFYTYYFSLTKNDVTGTLSFDGITEEVRGTAWIDRQYGTIDPSTGNEYEWFSVQLSNGMDLNIWNIFTLDNKVPEGLKFNILAGYVDENTQFTTSDFTLERLAYAFMPDNLRCYSQKWRISSEIYDIDIIVSALHADNEVELPFRFYEGATTVTGTVNGNSVTGKGFAELLHSYVQPEFSISIDNPWTRAKPISWQVNNSDDGYSLKYDLEYSTDQVNYNPIVSGITGNSHNWNDFPLNGGESCWVRLTGYSEDKTLSASVEAELTADESVGFQNQNNQFNIKVYPNPSGGQINVEGDNILFIEVLNALGKVIYSARNETDKAIIDLEGNKGLYFIRIHNREAVISKKIIFK